MNTTHMIPSNIEAEQEVLGAILIDPQSIHRIASMLHARDFYLEKHGWIYDALLVLSDSTIDLLTVVSELEKRGKLKDIGGTAYLTALINTSVTAWHIEEHARLVRDCAVRRDIINAACDIAGIAYEPGDLDDVRARAQTLVLNATRQTETSAVTSEQTTADLILEFRLRADEPREFVGLRCGLLDWERRFGGFQTGLYVLAGQTSHGKTAVAVALADGLAENNGLNDKRGLFVTLEMTAKQIGYRRLSRYCSIGAEELQTGYVREGSTRRGFTSAERQKVEEAGLKLAAMQISYREEHGVTASQIRAMLTEEKMRHGLDFAVIDYLHLLQFNVGSDNRAAAIGEATAILKEAADCLDIPIILLSQVSRLVSNRDNHLLTLSDMRDSGRIEENADVLICVTNEDCHHLTETNYTPKNIVDVYGLKDRLLGIVSGKAIQLAWNARTGAVWNLMR